MSDWVLMERSPTAAIEGIGWWGTKCGVSGFKWDITGSWPISISLVVWPTMHDVDSTTRKSATAVDESSVCPDTGLVMSGWAPKNSLACRSVSTSDGSSSTFKLESCVLSKTSNLAWAMSICRCVLILSKSALCFASTSMYFCLESSSFNRCFGWFSWSTRQVRWSRSTW